MKIKKHLKKAACTAAAAALLTSSVSMNVSAREYENQPDGCTITKISNTASAEGEIDGLLKGGNRNTSYSYQMAERGDDIYIAACRNVLEGLVESSLYVLSADEVKAVTNLLTNGDVPTDSDADGSYIIKYSKKTGEFAKLYTLPSRVRTTMAVAYGENVYFSTSSVGGFEENRIYRCDKNDKIEEVASFGAFSGASNCVYDGKLFIAGLDELDVDGGNVVTPIAVFGMDKDDDTKFGKVADGSDFGDYASYDSLTGDLCLAPSTALASYNGYIYITLPSVDGFNIFRGHSAADGEKANQYGWYWERVTGVEDKALYNSMYASMFVFKNELYVYDSDRVADGILDACNGGAEELFDRDDMSSSDYLETLYNNLNNPQHLWKLNNSTGKLEECEGLNIFLEGTCNEYIWSAAEYDGELYLATMDAATAYSYLTGSGLKSMTPEDMQKQLEYLKQLKDALSAENINEIGRALSNKINVLIGETNELINYIQEEKIIDDGMIEQFQNKYNEIMEMLQDTAQKIAGEFDEETVQAIANYFQTQVNDIMSNGDEFERGLTEIIGTEKAEQIKNAVSEFIEDLKESGDLEKLSYQLQNAASYYEIMSKYAELSTKIAEKTEPMLEEAVTGIDKEEAANIAKVYMSYKVLEALGVYSSDYESDEEKIDPVERFGEERAALIEEKIPELISLDNDPEYNELFREFWESEDDDGTLSAKLEARAEELEKIREEIFNELTEGLDEDESMELENYVYSRVNFESSADGEETYLNNVLGEEKADEIRQGIVNIANELKNDEEFMAVIEEIKDMESTVSMNYEDLDIQQTINNIALEFNNKFYDVVSDVDEETAEKALQYVAEQFTAVASKYSDFDISDVIGKGKTTKISMMLAKVMMKLNNDTELQEMVAQIQNMVENPPQELLDKMREIYGSIDWDGLNMYRYISVMSELNNAGFDIIKTSDGVTFEYVTDDGFGDRYNYGVPSMLSTEEGLYIGTANPFYGSQLWLLKNTSSSSGNKNNDTPKGDTPQNSNTNNGNDSNNGNDGNNNGSNNNNSSSPATGDNSGAVTAAAALLALSSAAIFALKKRKSE